MTAQRYILWSALLVFLIVLASLHWLTTISTSLLVGFFLAYLCLPLVNRFVQHGISRGVATALSMIILLLVIALILILPLPLIETQIIWLNERMPIMLEFMNHSLHWIESVIPLSQWQSSQNISQLVLSHWQSAGYVANFVSNWLLASGNLLSGIVTALILVPLVMFYCLRDWDAIFSTLYRLLPQVIAPKVAEYMRETHNIFSTFLHGQFSVILVLIILYSTGLWAIGLSSALLVGVLTGICSLIPYVGILVGSLLAIIAWFLQGGEWVLLMYIAGVFIIVQLFESLWLTPRLVGERLGLHPLAVIFALVIGGNLFGVGGMIFALPVLATIVSIIRQTLKT